MKGLSRRIHVFRTSRSQNIDARDRPGHDEIDVDGVRLGAYAVAMSGKTASILVFSVAALNGLTM